MLLLFYWCLFLLTPFGSPTPKDIRIKKGESATLFKNVPNMVRVSLYINGYKKSTNVVTWRNTTSFIAEWLPDMWTKYSNIYMDSMRNIMVANADENYDGSYTILENSNFQVNLIVTGETDPVLPREPGASMNISESGKKANETECVYCYVGCCGTAGIFVFLAVILSIVYRRSCWNFLKSYNPFCRSSEEKNGSEDTPTEESHELVPQTTTDHDRRTGDVRGTTVKV